MIPRNESLRLYHFAATLVAIGILLWALYYVIDIATTAERNYQQTQCNQGLLTLATLDIWREPQLSRCNPTLYNQLKEKYQ